MGRVNKLSQREAAEICLVYTKTNNVIETTKITHHSCTTVSKYLRLAGLAKGQGGNQLSRTKITDAELKEACKTLTLNEIAQKYGMHPQSLPRRFKKLGCTPLGYELGGSSAHERMERLNERIKRGEVKKSSGRFKPIFGESWHYVKTHDLKVVERKKGFRYIESRKKAGCQQVKLQCKDCGSIIIRDISALHRGFVICEECQAQEKRKKEKQKAVLKLCYTLYALKELEEPKRCIRCDKVFYSQSPSAKYCSKACREKNKRKNSIRKRCRKYKSMYDKNVTTKAVLERDGYKCQICGKQCDTGDRRWGSFGPDYPTIDHIIPLAKGGTHTWDNVQCACAMCNSTKRDLITA